MMLPMGTRSIGRAQGSPRGLHCVFCCYTDAETTWIPKAMSVWKGDSPAAAQSHLEGSRAVSAQPARSSELQEIYFEFQFTGASRKQPGKAAPTPSPGQETKSSVKHLPAADAQRKTRNKKRRWWDQQTPDVSGSLVLCEGSWLCQGAHGGKSHAPGQHLIWFPSPISNRRKSGRLLLSGLYEKIFT